MDKVIEYYLTLNDVITFVIGRGIPGNLAVHCSPMPYDTLRDLVRQFRADILAQQETSPAGDTLSSVLLQSLFERGLVEPGEKLALVPHRCLRYLPFSALSQSARPMLASNAIAYLPTSAALCEFALPARPGGIKGIVVKHSATADPPSLRESFDREALHVASLTNATILSGREAEAGAIEKAAARASLIHFCCHGLFDARHPECSGLLLTDGAGNDQILPVDSISRMSLDVDLVVLASCETALTERHPGDELVGLMRAFMTAGVRHVVATLWPVYSLSTELFVDRFYDELLANRDICDALHQAQLFLSATDHDSGLSHLRLRWSAESRVLGQTFSPTGPKSTRYNHPYHWSPFVLFGSGQ
jgi:CHAT domain-containing protein